MKRMEGNLGIDIGRVIMTPVVGGREDTAFLGGTFEEAMATPPAPGAFDGIRLLTEAFEKRVWLVSKAGPAVQDKTWHWLRRWEFYDRTGLRPRQVRFCLERQEKARHCAELKITHFIDDRRDVLDHLRSVVLNLYLFGEQPAGQTTPWATPVLTWPAAVEAILGPIPETEPVP